MVGMRVAPRASELQTDDREDDASARCSARLSARSETSTTSAARPPRNSSTANGTTNGMSAIIITGALMLPLIRSGITEASITRRFSGAVAGAAK